jgi:hypothetical protein
MYIVLLLGDETIAEYNADHIPHKGDAIQLETSVDTRHFEVKCVTHIVSCGYGKDYRQTCALVTVK